NYGSINKLSLAWFSVPSLVDEIRIGNSYADVLGGYTGLSSSATMTVNVALVPPTAPIDSDSTVNSVVEGAASGTAVGITAQSTDTMGRTLTYSLTNDDGGRFAIGPTSGVVTVANGSLLQTSQGPQTIAVQSSDGVGGTATSDFTVVVTQ